MDNKNQTLNVYDPCEDVYSRIVEHVGKENIEQLKVKMVGNSFTAELHYVDFKPSKILRREFEKALPNVEFIQLQRCFSYDSFMKVLQEILETNEEFYIKKSNGTLCPMSISAYLNEKLYNRIL